MADAMVTARMPQSKKDAGNKILGKLGYSASRAINELYDAVLETGAWPIKPAETRKVDPASLKEALAFVDGIARVQPEDFVDFDYHNAKQQRLIAKGRAVESDFE